MTILSYKVVEGWLLNPTYVTFSVQTKLPGPNNTLIVDRRYSDFDWLRVILVRNFPGVLVGFGFTQVPPIPFKELAVTKNLDKEFLENRLETLKRFLATCLDHPILRTSEVLEMFLNEDDGNKFTKRKLAFQNEKPFYHFLTSQYKDKDFTQDFKFVRIPTLTGVIRTQGSEKLKNYSVEVEKVLNEQKNSYVKIKENLLKANQELQQASDTIELVEKELKQLEKSSNDFQIRLRSSDCPSDWTYGWADLANTHRTIAESFGGLKWQLEGLRRSLRSSVYPEIKFSKKECEAGLEIVRYRNQAAQSYFFYYETLKKKKDALIATGDRNKWDLPAEAQGYTKEQLSKEPGALRQHLLRNESKVVKQMKYSYGFLNMAMVKEISGSMVRKAQREITALCGFNSERIELLKQDHKKSETNLDIGVRLIEHLKQSSKMVALTE